MRVQEEPVDDISRKSHDTHLSGGRADGTRINDLVDGRQREGGMEGGWEGHREGEGDNNR